MKFFVDKVVFEKYPNLLIGVVVARNLQIQDKQSLELCLNNMIKTISLELDMAKVTDLEIVKKWRMIYKSFGVDYHKYTPSIEQLLKRASQNKFPRINYLVDVYNTISAKYCIPAGGNNLLQITGDIALRIAGNQEPATNLIGQSDPIIPFKGEIIYTDSTGMICSKWNWKQDNRTKITEETTDAIFFFDAIELTSFATLKKTLEEFVALLQIGYSGEISFSMVDKEHQVITIPKKGELLIFNEKSYHHKEQQQEQKQGESQEYTVRKEKVEKLKALHIAAWPEKIGAIADNASRVKDEFEKEQGNKIYTVAGRIRAIRKHGKTAFITVQDDTGFLQIYIKKEQLTEKEFSLFDEYIDIGDIIAVTGTSFQTKMGEITLLVTRFALVSKCLRPLPEKFHGLTDTEIKYRQRYLDLISNEESKNRFIKRSQIIKEIRSILDEHGYMEVETPMLHPLYGGAVAKPFTTHHNALDMQLYLRIAPELYLKRLVIGGFPRVYEINRNFRNEGISTRHNPEFTMLEFYTAYIDYETIMNFTESLIRTVVENVCKTTDVVFNNHTVHFGKPFSKISMLDAVAFKTDTTPDELYKITTLIEIAKQHGIDYNEGIAWGALLALLFEHFVEKQLIQPTFVTQFPTDISPLAKKNPHNPRFTDRFELFVAGMELGNGFNELNDPFDQAIRFKEQLGNYDNNNDEFHAYDADYIQALEYALPQTSGVGIGIDRLVMFLTNAHSIRDVILFPTLKKK